MKTFIDYLIESKQTDLIDFIKHQTNIDLSKYRVEEYDRKGYITIDWKKLNRNEQNEIIRLSTKYPDKQFKIEDYGTWGKWIKFTK